MKKLFLIVVLMACVATICGQTSFKGVKVCQSFADVVNEMSKVAKYDGVVEYGGDYTVTFKTTFCGRTADVSVDRDTDGVSVHCVSACWLGLNDSEYKQILKELLPAYTQKYGNPRKVGKEGTEDFYYSWQRTDAEIVISTYGGVCVSYYPKVKKLINQNEI